MRFLGLTTFSHAPGPLHGLSALPGTWHFTCLPPTTPINYKNHLGPWVRNTDSWAPAEPDLGGGDASASLLEDPGGLSGPESLGITALSQAA